MKFFKFLFVFLLLSASAFGAADDRFDVYVSRTPPTCDLQVIERGLERHDEVCLGKQEIRRITVVSQRGEHEVSLKGTLFPTSVRIEFPVGDFNLIDTALFELLNQARTYGAQMAYTWTYDEGLYNHLLEEKGFSSAGLVEDYREYSGEFCCIRNFSRVSERPFFRGVSLKKVQVELERESESTSTTESSSCSALGSDQFSVIAKDSHDVVVGGAIANIQKFGKVPSCYLETLWVQPRFRGEDIGSRLILGVEDYARSLGLAAVNLRTFSHQAPKFYIKQGYTPAVRVPGCRITRTRELSDFYVFYKSL